MKNNKGTLNCKDRTFKFAYMNEFFEFNLVEGDLEDCWGTILLANGTIMEFNFYWENFENCKPIVTLYGLKEDENYQLLIDESDSTPIKVVEVVGTKADYFGLKFDNSLTFKFLLMAEGQIIYQTRKIEKVAREFSKRITTSTAPIKILLMDSNGATREYRNVN
jgi:hypothetical protein